MKNRTNQRLKRKLRVRAKIFGSRERPRLSVFRSNRAISAQIIDDERGITLVAKRIVGNTREKAELLGKELAAAAEKRKITSVVFDRSGYRFHGIVAALAGGARAGGLKF